MDSRVKQDRAGTHTYTSLFQNRPFYIQWLILGCALLVLAGVIAQNLYSSHERLEANEREHLQVKAKVVEQNMVRQLGTIKLSIDDILKQMDWWSKQKNGNQLASRHLTSLVNVMPGVRTILITDVHGTVIAANREQIVGQNFAKREYFTAPSLAFNPDTLYISSPFTTSLGVYSMSLSKALIDKEGRFAGVVTATLAPDEFVVLMSSVRYTPDMWVYLAHGTGTVFMMVPERADVAGKNLALPGTFFTRHMESGKTASTFVGNVHVTGENRLVALQTIQPSTLQMNHPLVVAVARDLPTMFAVWQRDAMIQIGMFGMLLLGTVSGLAFFQRRQRAHLAERACIEHKLHETSEELDRFFTLSLDLLCIADMKGHFLRLNSAWADTLGYSLDELEGAVFLDFVHPEDVESTVAIMSKLSTSKDVIGFTNRYRCKDGSYRWIEWHSRPYRETLIYAVARDITNRKLYEEMELSARKQTEALSDTVAKNERFLMTLADHLPGMVGYWNQELRCQFANAHYLEWFGKTPEEMKGITMQALMGESLFALNEPFVRKALLGESQQFERTLRKADGSVGYTWAHYIPDIKENGEVVGFFVLVSDITPLKKTEIELNRSRSELADLYENAPCGYHSLDADGRFIRVNRTEAGWLGYPRDELIGRKITEFLAAPCVEAFTENFVRLKQTGHVENVEAELIGKDGIPFSILLSATSVYDADGNYLMNRAAMIDIKERKRAEMALGDSEEKFRLLFEKAPVGIVTSKLDLKFTSANETFCKMFGYTSDELLHMTILDLTHPDYLDQTAKLITGISGGEGEHYLIEKKYVRKDGSTFWGRSIAARLMIESTQTPYFMGLVEDISVYKHAEEERIKSEANLQALLENIPHLIWLKDVDGRIIATNNAYLMACGCANLDDVLGKTDFDLWPQQLAKKYREDDIEVMKSLKKQEVVERVTNQGELRWVETVKSPIQDINGNLIGTTGFALDVTERIEQQERRLVEVQEQRDLLVREVHHRIKNNLQGVVGLLRQHALDHPEIREVIETIVGRIYSIALIHGMQAQSLSEEVCLCRLISSVVDASDGGVDFQSDLGCQVLLSREEAVPIALVLNELITNACKHRIKGTRSVARVSVDGECVLLNITNHFDDSVVTDNSGGQGLNLVKSLLPRKSADLAVLRAKNIYTVELKLFPPVTIFKSAGSCKSC